MNQKKCRSCKEYKDTSEFTPDRLGKFGVGSTCRSCQLLKSRKPVKKVGKKTLTRIKEKGTETSVHLKIWQTRPHVCEVCGGEIKFFDPSCFAHILPKGQYPEHRYDENNIALVHSIRQVKNQKTGETYQCHGEVDRRAAGKKQEFDELLKSQKPERVREEIKKVL